MQLDDRDRQILAELQTDGRLTNAELAEKVHLSPSACLRRVNLLLDGDLVAGTHLVLDQAEAGFTGTAYVSITLANQDRERLDAFEAKVRHIAQIQECYLLAGQSDYLLRVIFRDVADLERLHSEVLTRLPGVVRVQSNLTLRTVKRTTRVPV
ncbi:MAG: Lrp/AsnC family transcriptional regulator [Ancalomicrobiaceae bacterium]|nr:Lrp/AsnC family transcriptional regulator [Ancalomicrobiaceae bacterium]